MYIYKNIYKNLHITYYYCVLGPAVLKYVVETIFYLVRHVVEAIEVQKNKIQCLVCLKNNTT